MNLQKGIETVKRAAVFGWQDIIPWTRVLFRMASIDSMQFSCDEALKHQRWQTPSTPEPAWCLRKKTPVTCIDQSIKLYTRWNSYRDSFPVEGKEGNGFDFQGQLRRGDGQWKELHSFKPCYFNYSSKLYQLGAKSIQTQLAQMNELITSTSSVYGSDRFINNWSSWWNTWNVAKHTCNKESIQWRWRIPGCNLWSFLPYTFLWFT